MPSVWLSAEAGVLSCSDYDTGARLPTSSAGRTIGAYAHLRVRVNFRPREVRTLPLLDSAVLPMLGLGVVLVFLLFWPCLTIVCCKKERW